MEADTEWENSGNLEVYYPPQGTQGTVDTCAARCAALPECKCAVFYNACYIKSADSCDPANKKTNAATVGRIAITVGVKCTTATS